MSISSLVWPLGAVVYVENFEAVLGAIARRRERHGYQL
jgi:hypothetical protein